MPCRKPGSPRRCAGRPARASRPVHQYLRAVHQGGLRGFARSLNHCASGCIKTVRIQPVVAEPQPARDLLDEHIGSTSRCGGEFDHIYRPGTPTDRFTGCIGQPASTDAARPSSLAGCASTGRRSDKKRSIKAKNVNSINYFE